MSVVYTDSSMLCVTEVPDGVAGSRTVTTGLSRTCTEFMHQSHTGSYVPGTRSAEICICLIYGRIYVYSVWKTICVLEKINSSSSSSSSSYAPDAPQR